MKKYIIFCLCLLCANLQAQSDLNEALEVQSAIAARSSTNEIELRWVIGKPAVWQVANEQGYSIDRAEVSAIVTNYDQLEFRPVKGSPFKPWTEEKFVAYFETHSEDEPGSFDVFLCGVMLGKLDQEDEDLSIPDFGEDVNAMAEGKRTLENKFGFSMLMANQTADAARALGVRATDSDVQSGKEYVYRLTLAGKTGNYSVSPAYARIKAEPYDSDKYVTQIFEQEGDTEVIIKWEANSSFSSYNIDRKKSDASSYARITETPLLNSNPAGYTGPEYLGHKDAGLENYQTYMYRITANTAFADEVLIGEIELMPRDRTPPAKPYLELPHHSSPDEVTLSWILSPESSDLDGFIVGRGESIAGPFVKAHDGLLAKDERIFVDREFIRAAQNYYIIQAIDTSGNMSTSPVALLTLVDSIPPHQPAILKAEIDSMGVVRIKMDEQVDRDLMGFRIMKANNSDHEYSVIYESFGDSTIIDPVAEVYLDTLSLNTTTKSAWYKATALDYHYNESDPSVPVEVMRPDTISPVNPLFDDYSAGEKKLDLKIIPSGSDDVVSVELWKRSKRQKSFILLTTLDPSQVTYTDYEVNSEDNYQYQLYAIDASGNRSEPSSILNAKVYEYNFLDPVINLTAQNENDDQIVLNWEYEVVNEDLWFIIYRKQHKKWKKLIALKNPREFTYSDKIREEFNSNVNYKIQVRTKSNSSIDNKEVSLMNF